jgi:hypothetical protein
MSSGFVGGRLIPLALNPISVAHDGERRRCCGPTEMRDAAEPAPGRRIHARAVVVEARGLGGRSRRLWVEKARRVAIAGGRERRIFVEGLIAEPG